MNLIFCRRDELLQVLELDFQRMSMKLPEYLINTEEKGQMNF